MNILVTGSKGFVGKNFIQRFKNTKSVNIYEFHRKTSFNFLENNIKYIDLIFHFAGEVRPKSTTLHKLHRYVQKLIDVQPILLQCQQK